MNSKPWYQSATYYALAVAIVSKILMMAGLAEIDAGKQAGEIVTVVLPFVGICADLIAAWGRKRAQGPLTATKAGAESKNQQQGGFARPFVLVLLLAIAAPLVLMLPGCATNSPQTQLILETTTRMAVRRALAESDRAVEKAANIRAVAERLQGIVTAESTILGLRDEVLGEIDRLALNPLDRADAVDLVNLFAAILQENYGDDLAGDERVVKVRHFLDIVLSTLPAA